MEAIKIRNQRGSFKGLRIDGEYYHKSSVTQRGQYDQMTTTITHEVREGCPMDGTTTLAWRRLDDRHFEVIVVRIEEMIEEKIVEFPDQVEYQGQKVNVVMSRDFAQALAAHPRIITPTEGGDA